MFLICFFGSVLGPRAPHMRQAGVLEVCLVQLHAHEGSAGGRERSHEAAQDCRRKAPHRYSETRPNILWALGAHILWALGNHMLWALGTHILGLWELIFFGPWELKKGSPETMQTMKTMKMLQKALLKL